MSKEFKAILMGLMSLALFFGFSHLFFPQAKEYDFERLHIFLFNLCSGGTILLYYTEHKGRVTGKVFLFCILSVAYAILSFLKVYLLSVVIALVLSGIVEKVRTSVFPFFPVEFFHFKVPVSRKFHQASLLCLSIGLVISALVILNNEFLKLLSLPKLQLNTFFLGFSFPLSLITMSVMFSLIKPDFSDTIRFLKNLGFWVVNLGVITFFLFILIEKDVPQLIVSSILTCCVAMIFYLYAKLGLKRQQKNFLTSGMVFLLCTAITGMLYISMHLSGYLNYDKARFILRLHAFVSLYGWNLTGLAVICRYEDFPIRLHSKYVITLHWITALGLAPLGYYWKTFAFLAEVAYVGLLYIILFSEGVEKERA